LTRGTFKGLDENLPIIIEDNVWVCLGVQILPGVTVGEGAILAMGAIVTQDVPALAVVGGNPANLITSRDTTVYQRLKAKNAWVQKIAISLD
jgi:acetyltransferase-like isoleucine patch superfamily enzyme